MRCPEYDKSKYSQSFSQYIGVENNVRCCQFCSDLNVWTHPKAVHLLCLCCMQTRHAQWSLNCFWQASTTLLIAVILLDFVLTLSCGTKFIVGNVEVLLYFLSLFNTELVQVIKILPPSWKKRSDLSHVVGIMAADELALKRARASAAMVLTLFYWIILFISSLSGQNGRHSTDDILRCIFMNYQFCILIKIPLKFVP